MFPSGVPGSVCIHVRMYMYMYMYIYIHIHIIYYIYKHILYIIAITYSVSPIFNDPPASAASQKNLPAQRSAVRRLGRLIHDRNTLDVLDFDVPQLSKNKAFFANEITKRFTGFIYNIIYAPNLST